MWFSCSLEAEQAPRVVDGLVSQCCRIDVAHGGNTGRSESDPGGFVALTAVRDGSEIRGVGLDEYPVGGDRANDVVAGPVPERHDAAEGHVPPGIESRPGQIRAAGEAVEHSADPFPTRLAKHCGGIIVRIASVNDHGAIEALRELELHRERPALRVARRVVVVVVQATFADRDSPRIEETLQLGDVGDGIERRRIVRMNSGRVCEPARMRCGNPG